MTKVIGVGGAGRVIRISEEAYRTLRRIQDRLLRGGLAALPGPFRKEWSGDRMTLGSIVQCALDALERAIAEEGERK